MPRLFMFVREVIYAKFASRSRERSQHQGQQAQVVPFRFEEAPAMPSSSSERAMPWSSGAHAIPSASSRQLSLDAMPSSSSTRLVPVASSNSANGNAGSTGTFGRAAQRGHPMTTGELAQMALHIIAMIANSGGNERAFSVLGRTYSDKTRNLLNPERAHKSLSVQRDLIDNFPSTKRRRQRHIPFVQLRADVKSGAENIIPDDEEEPANGNITELTRHLDELSEDGDAGDDTFPEPEIAQAIQQPSIRLHFGTEELN
ncbi:hypothetical protein B0H10DRAFT_2444256 [Mycena sp. CBHHK59/15]|nr:hypothetical protein B0H10DRAFT_2444256 [Mycena sp. CBHHK59/15]